MSTQHNQLILCILVKIGSEYDVFVSAFHPIRFTSGALWKILRLDQFIDSLTHEQDKLIKMGTIKGSNAHALVVHESCNIFNPKSKQKGKGKVCSEQKKECIPNPLMIPPAPLLKQKEREAKIWLLQPQLSSQIIIHEEDNRSHGKDTST